MESDVPNYRPTTLFSLSLFCQLSRFETGASSVVQISLIIIIVVVALAYHESVQGTISGFSALILLMGLGIWDDGALAMLPNPRVEKKRRGAFPAKIATRG